MMVCANQVMAYGAIAVSDDVGDNAKDAGVGYGVGDTQKAAENDAMKECSSINKGCILVLAYKECGAYASSKDHSGTGIGSTEDAAKKAAKDQCGDDDCRVAASDCR